MEDFELLVHEAHQRDLKIILDIALNHTASTVSSEIVLSHDQNKNIYISDMIQHEWFQTSRQSRKNPSLGKGNWYFWDPGKLDAHGDRVPPNNWESTFTGR